MQKGKVMYLNLIIAMREKKITMGQLADLLDCRKATISNKVNGLTKGGFYFDEAARIRNKYFKGYDYDYLFKREKIIYKGSV
jgi:predicted transcriptional regulator